jgi:hypothetical protein
MKTQANKHKDILDVAEAFNTKALGAEEVKNVREKLQTQLIDNVKSSDTILNYIEDNPNTPLLEMLFDATHNLRLSNLGIDIALSSMDFYDKFIEISNS